MTEYNVRVSIVIPHWNGIDTLSECLISLFKTRHDSYEVIVVDNASTDGSQSWVKNTYPQVKLIENDKNYGYAGGCNRGALEANGDYLVFLNNDTIQDPDDNRYLSEDYTFCRRWQKIGGEIWLDPNTKLNHIGTYTFEGDVSKVMGTA